MVSEDRHDAKHATFEKESFSKCMCVGFKSVLIRRTSSARLKVSSIRSVYQRVSYSRLRGCHSRDLGRSKLFSSPWYKTPRNVKTLMTNPVNKFSVMTVFSNRYLHITSSRNPRISRKRARSCILGRTVLKFDDSIAIFSCAALFKLSQKRHVHSILFID